MRGEAYLERAAAEMVAMVALAAAQCTTMAAASQPALLQRHLSPSLLSSRVALSPSQLNLVKQASGSDGELRVDTRIRGNATCSGSSRGLSVVAMAKKGKKGGAGGSVVQKERAPGSDGGAKESAYANETRKIILSVHKLKKVCARPH